MFILVIWLLFGAICASMAGSRNRNGVIGFVAGLMFGIFAILYYLMAGKKA